MTAAIAVSEYERFADDFQMGADIPVQNTEHVDEFESTNSSGDTPRSRIGSFFRLLLWMFLLPLFLVCSFATGLYFVPDSWIDTQNNSILRNAKHAVMDVVSFAAAKDYVDSNTNNTNNPVAPVSEATVTATPAAQAVKESEPPEYVLKLAESVAQLTAHNAKFDVASVNLTHSIESLNKEISSIHTAISNNEKQTSVLKSNIASILDQVTRIKEDNTMLRSGFNKLSSVVSENQLHITRLSDQRDGHPPFILLSIDEWGTQDSAVIEMNGKVATALPGDIRAGWRINSFTKPNCIHVSKLGQNSDSDVQLCAGV